MCADVVVEGGGAGERAPAVAALEGPVAGVRDHVIAQLRRLGEGLGAVSALIRSETQSTRVTGRCHGSVTLINTGARTGFGHRSISAVPFERREASRHMMRFCHYSSEESQLTNI